MTTPTPRRSRRAMSPVTDPSSSASSASSASSSSSSSSSSSAEQAGPRPSDGPAAEAEPAVVLAKAVPPAASATPVERSPRVASAPTARSTGRLALVLALVGVLTLAGGGVFAYEAHQLRSTDSASNLALVDTSLTNESISSVSLILNRVFTYDYADPATTQKAAAQLLVGDASNQYKTLSDALQSKASGQQLTLKTTTVLGGVTTLTPDSARLLVFLDQSSSRTSDSSTSTAAAQLAVEAVKRDGVWKISEIRPL